MEREEIEAMWERIKALEENQLKVSKALAAQSILFFYGLEGAILKLITGKFEAYKDYMGPRAKKAGHDISNAENVDRVIEVTSEFTEDCLSFTSSLVKHG